MKYKLLLAGKATAIIDDFFSKLADTFEIMSTSLRHEDILRHVKYFKPHLFVYCMYNESRDDYNKMIALKYQMVKSRTYFVLIGSQTDCSDFERVAINVTDIVLVKPLTINAIETRLLNFLKSRRPLDMPSLEPEENSYTDSQELAFGPMEPPSSLLNLMSPDVLELEPSRKHILVVDDDVRMLKVLKEQLHDVYDVATAVSGKVAMRFLENKETDLILLDYEMPDEKGPDVLARIRANENTKDVPVIFLTGTTERDKIAKALAHKPQGYMLKPIDREKLLETITKVMGE